MWDFCVRKLGMSESESQRRIAAARVVRRFPHVLGYIERGELHLCAIYALRDHLTEENHDDLLLEASGKSTRAVEAMIAGRFPRPDVPSQIEPVEPQTFLHAVTPDAQPALSSATRPAERRPTVEPLSASRYRIELTVSAEIRTKLERIKNLKRHRNPTGDLETILDASLGLLLAKLEKERLGKMSRLEKNAAPHAQTQDLDEAEAPRPKGPTSDTPGVAQTTPPSVLICTWL